MIRTPRTRFTAPDARLAAPATAQLRGARGADDRFAAYRLAWLYHASPASSSPGGLRHSPAVREGR